MKKERIFNQLELIDNATKESEVKAKAAFKKYTHLKSLYDANRKLRKNKIQELDFFSKFKVGDKVVVRKAKNTGSLFNPTWVDVEGIISKVIVRLRKDNSIEYEYEVNKIKKDGSMSTRAINRDHITYDVEQLTKLELKINQP